MKSVVILGSTGSVGTAALKVVEHLPHKIKVVALAAKSNIELLEKQILQFKPELVAVDDELKAYELKKKNLGVKVVFGKEGVCLAASYEKADFVLSAISGFEALLPTIEAIKAGKTIGLGNKEVLVAAGEYVTALAKERGVSLIPVDSEHSAIFQCLRGRDSKTIKKIFLTASGGPFYNREDLHSITLDQALTHPNWKMGKKITIDCSTLMNKGLEVIEAHFLFGVSPENIEVVIHPQSIVHSMCEFKDGSIMAELSKPDMKLPIQYAMTYPDCEDSCIEPIDFKIPFNLNFFPPDLQKFKCLKLAYEALSKKKSFPLYLNAANEIMVERFLKGEIGWIDIPNKLEKLLLKHQPFDLKNLEDIIRIDKLAREEAHRS